MGNTLAAGSRASLRDLMARMGRDSPLAAMIYQHETSTAGQAIAAQTKAAIQDDPDDDGTAGVLVPVTQHIVAFGRSIPPNATDV
ncbi:hypothetical protein AB0L06_26300 [Spirillospora sp. NPDC052269]